MAKQAKKKRAKAGQPRKYETVEAMQEAIAKYFNKFKRNPTICGLALALGFASRQSLLDYEGYSDEFFDTIKKAKLRIEGAYERDLRRKGITGGMIFALKNFNWKDKQEHEIDAGDKVKTFLDWLSGRNGNGSTDKG